MSASRPPWSPRCGRAERPADSNRRGSPRCYRSSWRTDHRVGGRPGRKPVGAGHEDRPRELVAERRPARRRRSPTSMRPRPAGWRVGVLHDRGLHAPQASRRCSGSASTSPSCPEGRRGRSRHARALPPWVSLWRRLRSSGRLLCSGFRWPWVVGSARDRAVGRRRPRTHRPVGQIDPGRYAPRGYHVAAPTVTPSPSIAPR